MRQRFKGPANLFAALFLLTTTCGFLQRSGSPPADTRQASPPTEILSGFAVHGDEIRSFRRCEADEELWAVDRSGLLWDLHDELALHREPYEKVFAIVEGRIGPAPKEGFGADYPRGLEITRVLYMALEGILCDLDLSGFHYRAQGNEPFWSAWVSADGIVLRMPGRENRAWLDINEQATDNGALFTGDGPAGSIELEITDVPCRDSMSGAYFAYFARLSLDGEQFTGCTLKGTAPPRK
jgi:uncharacterized membrane protein